MKKPLAILLAFFIVFAPVYSNAVLPALAASVASNGGRVLVANTIKKVAPSALANAKKAMLGICQKRPNYCKGALGAVALKMISDGWNIDITNNDVTNIDVDIYKQALPSDKCEVQVGFGPSKLSAAAEAARLVKKLEADAKAAAGGKPDYNRYALSANWYALGEIDVYFNELKPETAPTKWEHGHNADITYDITSTKPPMIEAGTVQTPVYYRCVIPPTDKIYITNNELNQYITNNTTNNDIDLIDIYNFDFSQYNINIGGNTYNGTTINNDLSKSDPSEADKKVSPDLKKKLDDKTISLDDVNDQNCTKNEAGEYDKCGDKTDPTDPEEPTDPEPEPEPPPIECDANGFYKKVCDWMDWTQKPHDKPDSGNVDIIDKSEGLNIDQNRIDFTNQCPAPTPISTSVGGFPVSTELNYQPLCDFFTMLNPFVVGMGGISSALIIAGGARRG